MAQAKVRDSEREAPGRLPYPWEPEYRVPSELGREVFWAEQKRRLKVIWVTPFLIVGSPLILITLALKAATSRKRDVSLGIQVAIDMRRIIAWLTRRSQKDASAYPYERLDESHTYTLWKHDGVSSHAFAVGQEEAARNVGDFDATYAEASNGKTIAEAQARVEVQVRVKAERDVRRLDLITKFVTSALAVFYGATTLGILILRPGSNWIVFIQAAGLLVPFAISLSAFFAERRGRG
jgi:hypothetical protein